MLNELRRCLHIEISCPRCVSRLDTNNWKPLLTFHRRLIAGEVASESSTVSVVPTEQGSEVIAACGIRKTAWSLASGGIQ